MHLYTVWSGHWKASLIHCHWHLQPAAASAAASALRPFSSCLFFLIASRDFCLRNSNFDPPFVIDAVLMSEASLLCNVGITWKNGTLGDLLNKIDSIDKQSSFILLGFEDFLDKNNFYRQKYFFNHKNCTSNELFNNIKGSYRKNHFTYLILSQLALLPNIKENGIYLKDIVNTSIILITNKNCCKLTEYDINNIQWFHDKNNTISFKPDENLYTSNQEQIEKVEKCLLEYGIKLIKDTM